ncbi:hypothetical protein LJC58_09475 [Lachnospiraceae bacterium OttesenSCG-928-D06]|nr:hypothetical protein [Lachnospiraceae bacterium OttesenSCG-928-D06]
MPIPKRFIQPEKANVLALETDLCNDAEDKPNGPMYLYNASLVDEITEFNLSEQQKGTLRKFSENYEDNKDRYEKIAEATGYPAEIIAIIHYREAGSTWEQMNILIVIYIVEKS